MHVLDSSVSLEERLKWLKEQKDYPHRCRTATYLGSPQPEDINQSTYGGCICVLFPEEEFLVWGFKTQERMVDFMRDFALTVIFSPDELRVEAVD